MKERILSEIFEGRRKRIISEDKDEENEIYKGSAEEEYAGYLEKKRSSFARIVKRGSEVECKAVATSDFDEEMECEGENKVEIASLAESIKKHGMMLPVTAYRTGEKRYRIIDGRKRYRATVLLGREEIFCTILPCSEAVGEVLRISGYAGDSLLSYGQKAGALLLERALDRELLKSASLLSDRKIDALISIARLREREAATLRQITLDRLICEIAAIPDVRFRDYVIITFAELFKDFEEDVRKVVANKDRRYTPSDKMIFKDIRIVFNSIEGLLNKLRKSGIRVSEERSENGEEYTYTITVRKP